MGAECIVQRIAGYTVMSNYHLRDKRLGLKAKGLLSVMLSLPDDWDYTIAGLTVVLDEGKDSVRAAIRELEKNGYISRKRLRGEGGVLGGTQYIIREMPEEVQPPMAGFPTQVLPTQEEPTKENPTEIIKDQSITDQTNPSVSPKAERKPRKGKTDYSLSDEQMQDLIRQNVATLGDGNGWDREQKNGVYRLVLEFYDPRECNGKPPKHTARGVNGLFRNLAPGGKCTAQAAQDMLLTAIERGWTSVYPREERRSGPAAGRAAAVAPSAPMGEEMVT